MMYSEESLILHDADFALKHSLVVETQQHIHKHFILDTVENPVYF